MSKSEVVEFTTETCYMWECPVCKDNNIELEDPTYLKNSDISCLECGHEIFVKDVEIS